MGNQGTAQELNKRHQAFAELVADGATATDAYLAAGYSAEKRETLHRNASRLRRDPKIQAQIRELRREAEAIAREDTILSISRKLTYLARLVTTGAGGLKEDDELVQYSRTFKDGSTATRLPCKLKALQLHSRLAGHFDPPAPVPEPPVDPLDAALQELFDDIRSGRRRKVDHEGRAAFSESADEISGSREAASRILEEESSNEGRADLTPNSIGLITPRESPAIADVAPTSTTPSREGNPTNQNSNPHQTTSIVHEGRAGFSEAADLTSGLQGRVPSSPPKAKTRTPQLNFAPQPFPYPGHDFPELYGPKVRIIR